MAQRRMLYANLWQNEDFAKLTDKGKLLYIGLLTLSDDYGRLKNNAPVLRSQIFLYDDTIKNSEVEELITEIDKIGLIKIYFKDKYIYHPKWFKYQILRRDRLSNSLCPDPDVHMPTNWQPSDNQLTAEVSKQVSNISKNSLKDFEPEFIKNKKL